MTHNLPSRRYELSLILGLILISVFVLAPFTIRFRHGDEGIFIHDALRMLEGERLYSDLAQTFDPLSFMALKWIFVIFGKSFLALRLCFIAMLIVAVLLIYWIGRLAGLAPSLAAGSAILLLLSIPPFFSYSHHWQSTLISVAAVAFFMAAGKNKNKFLYLLAGVLSGLIVHSHLSKGAVMVGVSALWLIITIVFSRREDRPGQFSLSLWWGLGMSLALVIIPFWFYRTGLWPDYWYNVIGKKVLYGRYHLGIFPYGRTSVHRISFPELARSPVYAWIFVQQAVMMILPVIMVIGGLYQLFHRQYRGRRLLNPGNFLILSALGLCLSVFYAPVPYKMPTVIGLVFPALALIIQRSAKKPRIGIRRAGLFLGLIIALYGVKTAGMIWISLTDASPTIHTQLGPVTIPDRESAQEAINLSEYFNTEKIGNCAFVYPYGPELYFLCGLENPTRYNNASCAYTNPQDEAEIQEELNRRPDCRIVFIPEHWASSPEMVSWIRNNYQREKIIGKLEVWKQRN